MHQLIRQLKALALLLTVLTLASCGNDQSAKPGSIVLKVFVSSSGEITADGKPISLEDLSEKMAELKKKNGTVFYHRDNPKGGPHPNAMKVVELVVEHELPIRMSSKADGSDAATTSQPAAR